MLFKFLQVSFFKKHILLTPNQVVFLLADHFPFQFMTDINGPSLFFTSVLHFGICHCIWKHEHFVWIVYIGCLPAYNTNSPGTYNVAVKATKGCKKGTGRPGYYLPLYGYTEFSDQDRLGHYFIAIFLYEMSHHQF